MAHSPSPATHYPTMSTLHQLASPDQIPPHLIQQLMAAQSQQTLSSSSSAQGLQWLPTGSFQDGNMLPLTPHHQAVPVTYNNISSSGFSAANQLQGFGRPLMQTTPTNNNLNLLTRPLHPPPPASTPSPALQQVEGKADFQISQSSLLLAQNVAHHTQQVL